MKENKGKGKSNNSNFHRGPYNENENYSNNISMKNNNTISKDNGTSNVDNSIKSFDINFNQENENFNLNEIHNNIMNSINCLEFDNNNCQNNNFDYVDINLINDPKEKNDDYNIIEIIGSGTYGTVYKGKYFKTKEMIAIKKIKIEMENEGVPSNALREISILQDLKHPNIVNLIDVICKDHKLYLLFELLNYDLRRYLESIPEEFNLDEKLIKSYMYQLLLGVSYCHSKKVVHRDLKPANLLINEDGLLKIADFGLARSFSIPLRPYTREVLTLWYRSPEILLGCIEYSTSVDIWSCGCILAELYLKKPIFKGDQEIDQLYKIFQIKGTPNFEMWPEVVQLPHYKKTFPQWLPQNLKEVIPNISSCGLDLLQRLLNYDPNQRITAKQALNHVNF